MASMTLPFDTLDYAKRLEGAGVPMAQAEQQSKLLADVLSKSVSFPGDLTTLERSIHSRIDAAVTKLDGKIDTSTAKLDGKIDTSTTKLDGRMNTQTWMLTTLLAINIAIVLKLFIH